jgi:hypothetical protein
MYMTILGVSTHIVPIPAMKFGLEPKIVRLGCIAPNLSSFMKSSQYMTILET